MGDAIDAVAAAQHRRCPPDLRWRHPVTDHTASSRAIVEALKEAGALMPEEARQLREELAATRHVLVFADGLAVSETGKALSDIYVETSLTQATLQAAGCWPRGAVAAKQDAEVGTWPR